MPDSDDWGPPPGDDTDLGGQDRFTNGLTRMTDDARGDEAARTRSRERWLRHQAEEEANLAGVLVDLAERGDRVALTTGSGRRLRGKLRAVAGDFCALRSETGHEVLVRYQWLASVRPEPSDTPAGGDRVVVTTSAFADHLAGLAADRPRVVVTTLAPDESLAGVLQSVGRDVLVIRLDGTSRAVAYVPVDSVAEVSLIVSG